MYLVWRDSRGIRVCACVCRKLEGEAYSLDIILWKPFLRAYTALLVKGEIRVTNSYSLMLRIQAFVTCQVMCGPRKHINNASEYQRQYEWKCTFHPQCLHYVLVEGWRKGMGGHKTNQETMKELSKEKNQVTHLCTHFLISVLRMIATFFANIHKSRQNCSALFLEWPYVLPAFISHGFIPAIMGLLCCLYYYFLRSNVCNVNDLLSSERFPAWITFCGSRLCVTCNSIWDSFLVDCNHSAITIRVETLVVGRAVWWAIFGSAQTNGVQNSNLPGT